MEFGGGGKLVVKLSASPGLTVESARVRQQRALQFFLCAAVTWVRPDFTNAAGR